MFEVEIMREDEAVKVGSCSHPLHVLQRPSYYTGSVLVVFTFGLAKPATIGILFWREVGDILLGR